MIYNIMSIEMKCLLLIFLVLNIKYVSGQKLNLQGNSQYAVLNQPFIWQCDGEDYPGGLELIAFKLNKTLICEVKISQFTGNCSTSVVKPRIQCGCYDNNIFHMYLNMSKSIVADTGSWTCEMEMYGIQSSKVEHFVYYGPGSTITIHPKQGKISLKEGSELKLICTASCLSACSFQWLNDGSLITNASHLELRNLQYEDTGYYICQASNIVDTNSTSIYVQVLDEPLPPRYFKHVFSTADTICLVWMAGDDGGASQVFHVEVVRMPPDPSTLLIWKQAGDDIDEPLNGGPVKSCIDDLDSSTSYYFRVYASNVHHIGNSSLLLQATTTELNSTGLPFNSGLGLGVVLGLGLVIFGLFLGICIILKRKKQIKNLYDDTDGTALFRNTHNNE